MMNNSDRRVKVVELISNEDWNWPGNWNDSFSVVMDIQVPKLVVDVEDKSVWINKKGREKNFCVNEVWKGIKNSYPEVIWYNHVWFNQCVPRHSFILWMAIKGRLKTQDRISRWLNIQDMSCPFCKLCKDSHSHLFFSCVFSKRLWERLKGMAKLSHVSNSWAQVISSVVNIQAKNTIWSVIQRLMLGATVYFIWQERNMRLFGSYGRTENELFKIIVDAVRFRIMGLKLRVTTDVLNVAEVWCLPIDKKLKYRFFLDELLTDSMDIDGES